jgi:DNA-binding HxlR family transcriptional regulator
MCPVARTLNVIGERWVMLIVRDLFRKGPLRFQDFERSIQGLTPSVLSARLKALESNGIIESRLYAEHPPRPEYRLTEMGLALQPVLKAMKDWGERFTSGAAEAPPHPEHHRVSEH